MPKLPPPQTPEEKAQMKKPYIAQFCPYNIELVPGKEYLYCACGLSKNQPFCDDSHEGTPFSPIPFVGKKQKLSSICGCRRNDKEAGPYCDGSHTDIDW